MFDKDDAECIASGFHRDVFNGLQMANGQQSLNAYKERLFAADLCASTDLKPDNLSKHRRAEKTRGLELLSLLQTGMDVKVDYSNHEELKRLRQAYVFHAVNYVCHDRQRVFENDMKLLQEKNQDRVTLQNVFELAEGKKEEEEEEEESDKASNEDSESNEEEPEEELEDKTDLVELQENDMLSTGVNSTLNSMDIKDQGFTRPKVLILTPFKHMAAQVIEMVVFMMNNGKWKGISRRKKYKRDFLNEEDAFNDNFKMGIALKYSAKTKTSSVKLYEPFYESDIIVASPLAMRIMTGQETDETAEKQNLIDFDFLSSIEFLILDQAEAFNFQNTEHVEELMKVINRQPKKLSGLNDITRIKDVYTHQSPKLAKYLRQNIVIQKFRSSDLEFIFSQYCSCNVFGSVSIPTIHPNRAKEICQQQNIKITLRRLPNCKAYEHTDAARFNFFTKKLWDGIYVDSQGYTVVFVPNYFDFVQLRTFLKNKGAQVVFISEYSDKK